MNPEIKAKWVTALRSGEYRQGLGRLALTRSSGETRHCCLGVLCELAVKEGVIPEPERYSNGDFGAIRYGGGDKVLPQSVRDWAGLGHCDPYAGATKLSSANDSGYSFEKIADWIEEHL